MRPAAPLAPTGVDAQIARDGEIQVATLAAARVIELGLAPDGEHRLLRHFLGLRIAAPLFAHRISRAARNG